MPALWAILLLASLAASPVKCLFEWNSTSYPNPTGDQWKDCGRTGRSLICDVDGILDMSARDRLDAILSKLESQTHKDSGESFCDKKGISGGIALMRKIHGGSVNDARDMANALVQQWSIDPQCNKGIVIVMAVDATAFWVGRGVREPIKGEKLTQMFQDQKDFLRRGLYEEALSNFLKATVAEVKPSGGGLLALWICLGVVGGGILLCLGICCCYQCNKRSVSTGCDSGRRRSTCGGGGYSGYSGGNTVVVFSTSNYDSGCGSGGGYSSGGGGHDYGGGGDWSSGGCTSGGDIGGGGDWS